MLYVIKFIRYQCDCQMVMEANSVKEARQKLKDFDHAASSMSTITWDHHNKSMSSSYLQEDWLRWTAFYHLHQPASGTTIPSEFVFT